MSFYWPPGLPLYLAFFYTLSGAAPIVGQMAMILLYLGFSATVHLLGQELANRRAANLAVLIFAVYPAFIFYSIEPLTQLPTALCLLATVTLLLRVLRGAGWLAWLGLGLFVGVMILTRPSNLPFLGLIPLYLIWRGHWRAALGVGLSALILILGWSIKGYEVSGRFILVNHANARNFFLGNNPYTDTYRTWWFGSHQTVEEGAPPEFVALGDQIATLEWYARDAEYTRLALDHIRARPDLFLIRSLSRVRTFLAFDVVLGAGLGKLGLGLIGLNALFYCATLALSCLLVFSLGRTDLPREPVLVMLLAGGAYAAPYFISFSHPTYNLPLAALAGVLAAVGLQRMIDRPARDLWHAVWASRWRRVALIATLAGLAFIQVEWFIRQAGSVLG